MPTQRYEVTQHHVATFIPGGSARMAVEGYPGVPRGTAEPIGYEAEGVLGGAVRIQQAERIRRKGKADMTKQAKIKGRWESIDIGQRYEAKAVSPTGRVLGIVQVVIPVLEGSELTKIYGRALTRETIEGAARDLASRFLEEVPHQSAKR